MYDDSKTTEKTEAEITQEQKTDEITTEDPNYRENCVSIAYKDIARMPDNYEDLNVYFSSFFSRLSTLTLCSFTLNNNGSIPSV